MYNIFIRIYIFALFIWPTCQAADCHSCMFTGFISVKETLFCMTFEVGQPGEVVVWFTLYSVIILVNVSAE